MYACSPAHPDPPRKANGRAPVDLSVQLAEFFVATKARISGLCHFSPAAGGALGASCPGEKDTSIGEEKGSDLGFGKCDFVEFANVA